jgi:iron complex outermembrane receptor protein
LAGASITLKGTAVSTLSDRQGNYSISVPDDKAILVVSFVGYAAQEMAVGNSSTLDITLQTSGADLAQVVVVGYGTQSRRDVTGAVKSVKAESFNKGIINAPQQLLQGKVAGVNVTSASGEPGGIQGITVRGPGGVRTGSTPLFVVDGLPLDNSSTGGGDPLNFLNPADIERRFCNGHLWCPRCQWRDPHHHQERKGWDLHHELQQQPGCFHPRQCPSSIQRC